MLDVILKLLRFVISISYALNMFNFWMVDGLKLIVLLDEVNLCGSEYFECIYMFIETFNVVR
jgi:hypothetical protein